MRWRTVLTLCPVLWVLTAVSPARAEDREMVFARVDDLSSLGSQHLYGGYDFSTGRRFLADGREQSIALKHRFRLAYGVAPWLQLAAQQTVKHHAGEEARPGMFSPQLRVGLGALLPDSVGSWPMGLSLYFAPRVRMSGRRNSSLVFGVGTRTQRPRRLDVAARAERGWIFTANVGFEATLPDEGETAEVGPRYDAGLGYEGVTDMLFGFESWGHVSWADGRYVEQEHAFGPTVYWFVGALRLGVNGSAWLRHLPDQDVRTDLRATFLIATRL